MEVRVFSHSDLVPGMSICRCIGLLHFRWSADTNSYRRWQTAVLVSSLRTLTWTIQLPTAQCNVLGGLAHCGLHTNRLVTLSIIHQVPYGNGRMVELTYLFHIHCMPFGTGTCRILDPWSTSVYIKHAHHDTNRQLVLSSSVLSPHLPATGRVRFFFTIDPHSHIYGLWLLQT